MTDKTKARTISCRGSDGYISAINEIARRRHMKTADMVRGILDKSLKRELTDVLPFFDHDSAEMHESVHEGTIADHA